MQEAIARDFGVRVRLLQSADPSETVTLMEVYEDITDVTRFAVALDDAVRKAGFDDTAIGERRTERFQDV